MQQFRDSMLQLVIETSVNLPADVRRAIAAALPAETAGSRAAQSMEIVAQNIDLACRERGAAGGIEVVRGRSGRPLNQYLLTSSRG